MIRVDRIVHRLAGTCMLPIAYHLLGRDYDFWRFAVEWVTVCWTQEYVKEEELCQKTRRK